MLLFLLTVLSKTKQWLRLFPDTSGSFYFAVLSFLPPDISFLSLKIACIFTLHDMTLNIQSKIHLLVHIGLWYLLPLV